MNKFFMSPYIKVKKAGFWESRKNRYPKHIIPSLHVGIDGR